MKNTEAKKIEGLPLKYRGFTIKQDYKVVTVKHPFNPCLNYDKILLLNKICISKDFEEPVYNEAITMKKTLLCSMSLSDMYFKTVEKAKKEIDSILSIGYYWIELIPREQAYIKANMT